MGTVPPPDQVLTRRVGGLRHKWQCHLCPWHNWHVQLCQHSCVLHTCFNAMSARERKGKVMCHPCRACDARRTSGFGSPLNTHFGLVGGPWCCAALRYSSATLGQGTETQGRTWGHNAQGPFRARHSVHEIVIRHGMT